MSGFDKLERQLKAELRLAWWRAAMAFLSLALMVVCAVNACMASAEGKTEKALMWVSLAALIGLDSRTQDIERKIAGARK